MWVATGHSGIHRYRDGAWTWYQPFSNGGPGFYEVKSMALAPPPDDMLVITTVDAGIWAVRSPDDPVIFEQVAPNSGTYGLLQQVRRDVSGNGVYLFNDTSVVRFTNDTGFIPVLIINDLSNEEITLNDLASAPGGNLYLATDDGIYIWNNGKVVHHISRFEGSGTSEIIRTVFVDALGRIWFSSQGYVGFFSDESASGVWMQFEPGPAGSAPVTTTVQQTSVMTPVATSQVTLQKPDADAGGLSPILNPIMRALNTILSKLGLSPATP